MNKSIKTSQMKMFVKEGWLQSSAGIVEMRMSTRLQDSQMRLIRSCRAKANKN